MFGLKYLAVGGDSPRRHLSNDNGSKFPLRSLSIISIFISFGILMGFFSNSSNPVLMSSSPSSLLEEEKQTKGQNPLYFTFDNIYTKSKPLYSGYPWSIVEPFRDTTFYAVNGAETSTFSWVITDSEQNEIARLEGEQVVFLFTKVGEHTIQLTETVQDSKTTKQFLMSVRSKYVRREIRSLTDQDRENFFNAFATLAKVPMAKGIELFGEKYRDKDFFNKKHAGDYPDCSHIHKGTSFLPSHVALTLEFEQSLQTIDPSITVPYWDYTYDDYLFQEDWRLSPLFADDWFGTASPSNPDHVVDSGRWAYFPIKQNAWDYSTMHNSYGLLTEPWNNNPQPYLSRSDTLFGIKNTQRLPSCEDHQKCLQIENWMDFTFCIENDAHENVHQLIGGIFDTNTVLQDLIEANPEYSDDYLEIAARADRTIQTFITAGWLSCPEQCDADTPYSECQCSCEIFKDGVSDSHIHKFDNLGLLENIDFFYTSKNVEKRRKLAVGEKPESALFGEIDDDTKLALQNMVTFYCDPGKIGDMYGSMSTNDITFWPIHPTLDRIWAWQRVQKNPNYDETWVLEDVSTGCEGHNPDDVMPWRNLLNEKDTTFYTNRDLYIMFDPRNPDLPYVYDNFEWSHCEASGYQMSYSSDRLVSDPTKTSTITNQPPNQITDVPQQQQQQQQQPPNQITDIPQQQQQQPLKDISDTSQQQQQQQQSTTNQNTKTLSTNQQQSSKKTSPILDSQITLKYLTSN